MKYNNIKLLNIKKMKKQSIFDGEYFAPDMEVVIIDVEAGFALSSAFTDIPDAEEDNYGDF